MRTVRRLPLLTLLLLGSWLSLTPASAWAEENYLPGELGGFIGAHFFNRTIALGRRRGDAPNFINNSFVVGIRGGGYFVPRFGLEGEVAVLPTSTRQPNVVQVPIITARGHAIFNILTGKIRPFLLFGGGVLISVPGNENVIRRDADGFFYGGVGVKWDLTERLGFRLDGRIVVPRGLCPCGLTTDWEVLWTLYGRLGKSKPKDPDGDGLIAPDDACPNEKGPKENKGCPDKDADGDKIVDRLDKCPNEAGIQENQGCPDRDADNDGVVDRLDKCPSQPGPSSNNGCPEPDADGDKIIDRLDKCPNEAGIPENQGCPDRDADNDGVVDRLDKCPQQPESRNGYQDADGCPDEVPRIVRNFTGVIKGINFATGKATILSSSYRTLDAAVKVLRDYPDVKLEISGHTDNTGSAEINTKLSHDRAEAVKAYMVSKGIDASRLRAMGYGPSKPLADNRTNAGRSKNRRVEFQLIP
ncbi:MAG TPA: OmpA family protein [Polyangia bacterium]|jgi:OOP family OmpA-OmpF porin|nr:OmpA family protein [Polyangia bacterium]